jgi:glycosyltransferase involved in cell wall biosynthesis
MRVLIIIPAYNEEEAIAGVIEEIRSLGRDYDIVVVDDGSTDRTFDVAAKTGVKILHLPVNLGIGAAVQTGFKYALRNNYDVAVQVDGDGQHPPSEVPKLIEAMEQSGADIVIGSRFLEKKGFQSTFSRRVGINYFRFLHRMLTRLDIADSTSGFRALNRRALEMAEDYYPDEYPEAESLVPFALHGLKVVEAPVAMRERRGGVSSIKKLHALYYMFKVTIGILFTYLRLKKGKK